MLPYSLGSEETWDVEEMKRTKLFTDDKCRYIIRERREYDFKINGISKCLNDFKEYIIFEKTLLKELHSQVGNKRDAREARNSIELKIMKKIRRIYETAMLWFTNDFQLHLSYFQFCKQIKNYSGAAATLQKMIKNFDHNAEVWRVAANWHAHDQNNISAARTVLLKGISLHKNSEVLYTEAIKLELSVVKGDQNSSEEVNALKEQVYKKIEECIRLIDDCTNDPKYFIEALHLLENYSFTSGLQFEIVEKLCLKYSKKGIVWHTLAQRAKRGVETGYSKEDRLNTCLKLYGEGLRKVSREDKPGLWTSYLDCLFEAKAENDIFVKIIKNALEHASDEDCLAEKYYIEWLNLLSSDEKALDILKKGIVNTPVYYKP